MSEYGSLEHCKTVIRHAKQCRIQNEKTRLKGYKLKLPYAAINSLHAKNFEPLEGIKGGKMVIDCKDLIVKDHIYYDGSHGYYDLDCDEEDAKMPTKKETIYLIPLNQRSISCIEEVNGVNSCMVYKV